MPFLVDSVSMEVTRSGSAIHLVIRPIMRLRRDEEGRLLEVGAEDGQPESLIHVEIDRQASPEALERLRDGLCRVLGDVRAAVEDWPAMRERVRDVVEEVSAAPVDPDERAEARDLLEWMDDGHFTFLGYREYEILAEDGEDVLRAVSGSGLGILRATDERPISVSFAQLPPEVRRLAREKSPLSLTKANSRATVHRPAYLDYVGVKRFDDSGEVVRRAAVPRALHAHRVQRQPVGDPRAPAEGSASGRALGPSAGQPRPQGAPRHPRDLPARRAVPDLGGRAPRDRARDPPPGRAPARAAVRPPGRVRTLRLLPGLSAARAVRHRESAARSRTSCRRLSAARASTTRRASRSRCSRASTSSSTRSRARFPEYDVGEIEARLAAATRAWADDLRDALSEQLGEERAGPLFERYGEAFPGAYREDFSARQAVLDIERIERLDPDGDLGMSLYVPLECDARSPRVQAGALGAAAPPLRRAAAAREHGRQSQRRASVRGQARRPAAGLDLRLRAPPRRGGRVPGGRRARDVPGRVRTRVARGVGERRLQPTRPLGAADRARDHDPPCDREVPPPGGKHLQPELHGGRALCAPRRRAPARRALPASARPSAVRGHRRQGAGTRARPGEHDRCGREPRRGSDPARLPARRPGSPADELLPDGRRRPGEAVSLAQAGSRTWCRTCPSRGRCSRSSSTRRASRPCTSAAGGSRAEASAGPTAARTSAPRCSG